MKINNHNVTNILKKQKKHWKSIKIDAKARKQNETLVNNLKCFKKVLEI